MKAQLMIAFVVCMWTTDACGQDAKEYFERGLAKHKQQDYLGAIKDYSDAIKADRNYVEAYFNRGTCELELQDIKSSIGDFTKAIQIGPRFARAYYGRASIYAGQQKYFEAIRDLNNLIEIDPKFPNALTLRGQIRAQMGDRNGGCDDFSMAKKNEDPKAEKYIQLYCGKDQMEEAISLALPENEGWKLADDKGSALEREQVYIHRYEKPDNWTEKVSTTTLKGVIQVGMDKAMDLMYQRGKLESPKMKLVYVDKDEKAEHPWIIFELVSPTLNKDGTFESQLWYVVQGKQALYANFFAVNQTYVPAELKDKWIKIFKQTKIGTT